jgi:hypothetical protein
LHPYRTHVLCPPNLCPNVDFPENFEGFCVPLRWVPLSLQGRGCGLDKPFTWVQPYRPKVDFMTKTQA